MAQIQKGTTYITGDQVTAANLNALADSAILLPGAITDQTAKTVPLAADTVLIHSAADTALRKSTLTQVFSNATGIPISTGISGLGTGVATALAINVGTAGAPVVLNGAGGTPSSQTLTNATGLPISTGVSGLGTGIATALAVNTGSAGAPVLFNGALGTPSSGTVTNLTGTASININGTVGATTASTGAFTTLSASTSATVRSGLTGLVIRDYTAGSLVSLYSTNVTASNTNYSLSFDGVDTYLNGATSARLVAAGTTVASATSTGLAVTGALSSTTGANFATSSGNVGIGTSSPLAKLQVSGGRSYLFSGDNYSVGLAQTAAQANYMYLGTASDGTFYISESSGTARVTVQQGGNVGIGTSSPAAKLDIQSASGSGNSVYMRGGTYSDIAYATGIRFLQPASTSNSNRQFRFTSGDSSLTIQGIDGAGTDTSDTKLILQSSGGSVLVGTTTQINGGVLNVLGTATSTPLVNFQSNVAGDVGQAVLSVGKYDNNTTTSQVWFRAGIHSTGAGCGQINSNGANALAFGTFSDARLKENIVNLPPQLENIMALRPVEFDYIKSEGGGHQIGFVAQEIEAVYSDAVGDRGDGMKTVSGWSKTEARLVKALQELNANLVAQVAALSQRISALESSN